MPLSFAAEADAAIPIRLVDKADAKDALATLSGPASGWAEHHGFAGTLGQTCAIPGASGRPDLVLLGTGDAADRERTRFAIGAAIAKLPEAVYAIRGMARRSPRQRDCTGLPVLGATGSRAIATNRRPMRDLSRPCI